MILVDESKQKQVGELYKSQLDTRATVIVGHYGWFLEILHPQVTKGGGLERMCHEFLQIPMDECLAIGDGDNDIEFLQMAGWGMAVQNATHQLKENAADEILEWNNDEHAVMNALKRLDQDGRLLFQSS